MGQTQSEQSIPDYAGKTVSWATTDCGTRGLTLHVDNPGSGETGSKEIKNNAPSTPAGGAVPANHIINVVLK